MLNQQQQKIQWGTGIMLTKLHNGQTALQHSTVCLFLIEIIVLHPSVSLSTREHPNDRPCACFSIAISLLCLKETASK